MQEAAPENILEEEAAPPPAAVEIARLAVAGDKPAIEDTLIVAEAAKLLLTGARLSPADFVPPDFRGTDTHAYFLPEDAALAGVIDAVLIAAPDGFSDAARERIEGVAMQRIRHEHLDLTFDFAGYAAGEPFMCGTDRIWRSATPFLRGFDPEWTWQGPKFKEMLHHVARLAAVAGLPIPRRVAIKGNGVYRGKQLGEFIRDRRDKKQPDWRGSFLSLYFDEPVTGPLALGHWAHYGMGLFLPHSIRHLEKRHVADRAAGERKQAALRAAAQQGLFHTRPAIAAQCWNIFGAVAGAAFDRYLEPGAGAGAFLQLMPADRRCGIDIEPAGPGVEAGDFMDWQPEGGGRLAAVGCPPFGKKGKQAAKFLRRAMRFAAAVGFIMPAVCARPEFAGRFRGWTLAHAEALPAESFLLPDGAPYNFPCVFQVWLPA